MVLLPAMNLLYYFVIRLMLNILCFVALIMSYYIADYNYAEETS